MQYLFHGHQISLVDI